MLEVLIASFTITLLSTIGVFFFGRKGLSGTHRYILPTAVGVFLGVVFFELIPETLEASHEWGPIVLALGFLGFYFLSHYLETFHHHHFDAGDGCASTHRGARMLLIGDSIHNLADGVVIATAFMIDPLVGTLTTIGVALHEIPQEIAEYGVLITSGYSKKRALILNLLSASTVVLGALLTYAFGVNFEGYLYILTGIAGGNLLYIATADFIPELRHSHRDHFGKTFIATCIGLILIGGIITYSHEAIVGHDEEESSLHAEDEAHDVEP